MGWGEEMTKEHDEQEKTDDVHEVAKVGNRSELRLDVPG